MDRVYLIVVENSFDEECVVDFAITEEEAIDKVDNLNSKKKIQNYWVDKLKESERFIPKVDKPKYMQSKWDKDIDESELTEAMLADKRAIEHINQEIKEEYERKVKSESDKAIKGVVDKIMNDESLSDHQKSMIIHFQEIKRESYSYHMLNRKK